MRIGNSGKKNPNCYVSIEIEGIVFKSITDASQKLKMAGPKIIFRLKSKNPIFKNWNYLGKAKISEPIKYSLHKKYKIKNIIYPSIVAAAKACNKSTSAMIFRAKSSNPKWDDYSFVE